MSKMGFGAQRPSAVRIQLEYESLSNHIQELLQQFYIKVGMAEKTLFWVNNRIGRVL